MIKGCGSGCRLVSEKKVYGFTAGLATYRTYEEHVHKNSPIADLILDT